MKKETIKNSGLLAALAGLVMSGCYYTTQGFYLLSYQSRAVAVDRLLSDQNLAGETRDFLNRVKEIKAFAVEELGLELNKNYTRFLSLDQDVLAYVVSASEPLSFVPHLWNYPFLGKMPYKGFYRLEDARREGKRLSQKGQDVWIRGVEAFSTLGFFKDPLVSYMTRYSVYELADLIIHEQTHATIWKKNDTAFNEDLAAFVGEEGARLFIKRTYGEDSEEYRRIDQSKTDAQTFRQDILALKARLEVFYSQWETQTRRDLEEGAESRVSRGQRREREAALRQEGLSRRDEIIRQFKEEFSAAYEDRYAGEGYRSFTDLPVNNAYLELFTLYHGQREWFEEQFRAAGEDMRTFIQNMKMTL
ncbi:MAG: aminopeptidase [Spirochaetales bacterium]|nr:aminopeptidase [Spirochaetales bacterium]